VYEQAWFYRCEEEPKRDPDCAFRVWKDTSGRYLDRAAVAALLRDGRSGSLDGFTARDGRTYRGHLELDREQMKVVVRSEGFSGEGESAQPEYEVDPEPLGRCPSCGQEDVVETPTQFVCAGRRRAEEEAAEERRKAREAGQRPAPRKSDARACGFVLPRTVCKREISRKEALVYLQTGRTELLEDFTSRFGRPFSAVLFLKENGRHGFEFPPRGAAARAEGEGAAAEPRTPRRRPRREKPAKGPAEGKPAAKAPAKPARAAARAPRARARRKRPASGDTGS
jgi:DNA topoisomerase-3